MQPHRRQRTRLPRPWDSPSKNTGVGCHFLLQCIKLKSANEVAQSCLTLPDPMDCSSPGSSIHGIFQARVLEWGAIAFLETCNWDHLYYPLTAQFSVEGRYISYLSWYFLDLKNHPVEPRQSKKSWKQYIIFVLCQYVFQNNWNYLNCSVRTFLRIWTGKNTMEAGKGPKILGLGYLKYKFTSFIICLAILWNFPKKRD